MKCEMRCDHKNMKDSNGNTGKVRLKLLQEHQLWTYVCACVCVCGCLYVMVCVVQELQCGEFREGSGGGEEDVLSGQ